MADDPTPHPEAVARGGAVETLPDTLAMGPARLARYRPALLEPLLEAALESYPEIHRWLRWAQAPLERETFAEFIRGREADFDRGVAWHYAMVGRDERVVGGAGIFPKEDPHALEIGYWVRTSCTRQGLATAATRALTSAAFTYLSSIERVHVLMDQANVASAGVPRALGFTVSGPTPRPRLTPGHSGLYLTWTMTRDEWGDVTKREPA